MLDGIGQKFVQHEGQRNGKVSPNFNLLNIDAYVVAAITGLADLLGGIWKEAIKLTEPTCGPV